MPKSTITSRSRLPRIHSSRTFPHMGQEQSQGKGRWNCCLGFFSVISAGSAWRDRAFHTSVIWFNHAFIKLLVGVIFLPSLSRSTFAGGIDRSRKMGRTRENKAAIRTHWFHTKVKTVKHTFRKPLPARTRDQIILCSSARLMWAELVQPQKSHDFIPIALIFSEQSTHLWKVKFVAPKREMLLNSCFPLRTFPTNCF